MIKLVKQSVSAEWLDVRDIPNNLGPWHIRIYLQGSNSQQHEGCNLTTSEIVIGHTLPQGFLPTAVYGTILYLTIGPQDLKPQGHKGRDGDLP